jgi:hypothetical protein
MFGKALTYEESSERVYCSYSDRYLKRSFVPSEYKTRESGGLFVPFRSREKLENEVACLKFIREKTDIHVPEVLDAYKENGSFFIWTARVEGVPLKELKDEDRSKILPEIRRHIAILQTLWSNKTGGPSGILCLPYIFTNHYKRNTTWQQISAEDFTYVLRHSDLQVRIL